MSLRVAGAFNGWQDWSENAARVNDRQKKAGVVEEDA
jgi:hypothetical protein